MTNLQYNIGAPRPIPDVYRFAGGADEVLVLDFVNNRGLRRGSSPYNGDADTLLATVHSNHIYMPQANGDWVKKAASALMREDGVGLQVVPTRTQYVRGTNMAAAVEGVVGSGGVLPANWATTGVSITYTVIGKGVYKGLPYIDVKFSAVAAGSVYYGLYQNAGNQAPAAVGEKWIMSGGMQTVGGKLPAGIGIRWQFREFEADGATTNIAQTSQTLLETDMLWYEKQFTVLTADTAFARLIFPFIEGPFGTNNLANLDHTVRLWGLQTEKGDYATPFIESGSANETRNGNQDTVATDAFDNGVCGFLKANIKSTGATGEILFAIGDGANNDNQVKLVYDTGNIHLVVRNSDADTASVNIGAWTKGEKTIVFAVGPNYAKARIVGGSDPAADNTVTMPTTIDTVSFGGNGYDATENTYAIFREVSLRNVAGSEAELDAIYDNIALLESMTAPANIAARVL